MDIKNRIEELIDSLKNEIKLAELEGVNGK
jgi:hypothetical protein